MDFPLQFQHQTIIPGSAEDDNNNIFSSSDGGGGGGYRLVPWVSWDEWDHLRQLLFSPSHHIISSALQRVSTWRSRGCLPVVVDVTASIIEIQQKDPFFRKDLPVDAIHSEQMLAMLYCMAILRLVNCVVEKTRKRTEISIAEAAGAIGISRTIIDIRHEGSHRDLPALPLVRDSATKAVDWLKSYYWEPQMKQIPFQGDGTAKVRKEIKSKLCELAFCLKVKQTSHRGSSLIKEKRPKKQIAKILKSFVSVYTSFSSEVLFILLELLFEALDCSNMAENQRDDQVCEECTLLDDWKRIITKLSDKEPELLLMLLKAISSHLETQEAMKYENGTYLTSADYGAATGRIEQLSSLFAWIVRRLTGLRTHQDTAGESEVSTTGMNVSNTILMEILRKCILVSYGNRELMDSALKLAQQMGEMSLVEKLSKLGLVGLSTPNFDVENSLMSSSNNFLVHQNEAILEGSKKLELLKLQQTKSSVGKITDGKSESSGRWVVAKSWNPCAIGMLPRELGSSGRLPVLAGDDMDKTCPNSSRENQTWKLNNCTGMDEPSCDICVEKSSGKREASPDIYSLDGSNVKKMREKVEANSFSADKDCLLIDGVWKKMGEDELLAIKAVDNKASIGSNTRPDKVVKRANHVGKHRTPLPGGFHPLADYLKLNSRSIGIAHALQAQRRNQYSSL